MRSGTFHSFPSLTVAFSLAALACSDGPPTPTGLSGDAISPIAAHSPSYLKGGNGGVSTLSVPDYTDVVWGSASTNGGGSHLFLTVFVDGTLPRFPDSYTESVAVFGYAWADLGTGHALVAVIHPVIGRDSHQNPDAWHTHPVELTSGTGTSDFCIVSIGTSQGGIAIGRELLRVHIPEATAGVSAESLDVVAAFIVQGDTGCTATGLGVHILDSASI